MLKNNSRSSSFRGVFFLATVAVPETILVTLSPYGLCKHVKTAQACGLTECLRTNIAIDCSVSIRKTTDEDKPPAENWSYPSALGGVLYVAGLTRPDIALRSKPTNSVSQTTERCALSSIKTPSKISMDYETCSTTIQYRQSKPIQAYRSCRRIIRRL